MDDFPGKSPSPVSDDHLRAIGAIIVNWSAIEVMMEHMILGLYKIDFNKGLVLTSNIGFQSRMALLRILATKGAIEDPADATTCTKLLNRIETAYSKRNLAAHGLWSEGKAQGLARRMAIRVRGSRLATTDDQVPLMDLEAAATEILEIGQDFRGLTRRLGIKNRPNEA